MSSPANRPAVTAYRVEFPLRGFTKKPNSDTVIPVGSTVEWHGDYAGGMASVLWLRRRVLVLEAELFAHCQRIGDGPSTQT
jgi:hypothetical protein